MMSSLSSGEPKTLLPSSAEDVVGVVGQELLPAVGLRAKETTT